MKSVLIIGLGRFGTCFAKKMVELGNEVMAIDTCAILIYVWWQLAIIFKAHWKLQRF